MGRKWTLMIVPHVGGKTRNLNVARWHLWLFLICIGSLGGSALFYWHQWQQLKPQEEIALNLRIENERLLDKLGAQQESISLLQDRLDSFTELEKKVRALTGLASSEFPESGDGQGGPAGEAEDRSQPTLDNSSTTTVPLSSDLPSAELQDFSSSISKRYASLSNLLERMGTETKKWGSVPTVWPVGAAARLKISSPFGMRKDPVTKKMSFHEGVDISAPLNSKVQAAADGTVIFARWDGEYGPKVIIDHANGFQTVYCHNSKLLVKSGDKVKKGDNIAQVGNFGRSTGPHVHYEILYKGKHQDPMKYMVE